MKRGYSVLDNHAAMLAYRDGPVVTRAGLVASAEAGPRCMTVTLDSGVRIRCGVVIDASGQRRVLAGGRPRGTRVEQTAYGVVVPAPVAEPLVGLGDAVFMRWSAGEDPAATFLYAVPLSGGRTLLEETSLARRPGMPIPELKARLARRLAAAGVDGDSATATERVRFAVDVPLPRRQPGVVAFGVAAGMMHPATGYSVGDALVTAPMVAAAIAEALPRGGPAAARAAHATVWSPAARAVRQLRVSGLRTLLAMAPSRLPDFFDAFFELPDDLQRAYLSGREDVRGTAAAMSAVFNAAPWGLRLTMATGWLRGWSRSGSVAANGPT